MSIRKFTGYDEEIKAPFESSPYDVPDEFETEDKPAEYWADDSLSENFDFGADIAETPFAEVTTPDPIADFTKNASPELLKEVEDAHVRTFLAWDNLCKVRKIPFHPHREKAYQEYFNAVHAEVDMLEKYAANTGLIPMVHLPFELFYLYYKQGPARERWKKICDAYKKTGVIDIDIEEDTYNPYK